MFTNYNTDPLLPMDVEYLIPQNHLARVINTAFEKLDLNIFLPHYSGGGRPPYHPKMMLKIILFAYDKGIYSSRNLATQLRENIYFIWLFGHQTPRFPYN